MSFLVSFNAYFREAALFPTALLVGWKASLYMFVSLQSVLHTKWHAELGDFQCFILLEQDSICSQEISFLN